MVPKIATLISDSINLIIFDRLNFSHILKLNDSIIIIVCNVLANYAYTGKMIQNDSISYWN